MPHLSESESLCKLMDACDRAVMTEEKTFESEYRNASWHNNNVDGVGQSVAYAEYPTMPKWVEPMKEAMNAVEAERIQEVKEFEKEMHGVARQYGAERVENVDLTQRNGQTVSAWIDTPGGWATITPGKGEFELTVTREDLTDYGVAEDGAPNNSPQDEVVFNEKYETIEEVRDALKGEFNTDLPKAAADRLDEALQIKAGERGDVPASYRPSVDEQKRLGYGVFYQLNPQVSPNEMLSITHNKVIKSTPEALDRWAESRGLEVAHEAKWDNVRGSTIYDKEPFRVVSYRDKETQQKLPGTFVTDRIQTTHVSTSFRSTVEASFEAHEKYGPGDSKDARHIKHVIDNAKQMEREWEREEQAKAQAPVATQAKERVMEPTR